MKGLLGIASSLEAEIGRCLRSGFSLVSDKPLVEKAVKMGLIDDKYEEMQEELMKNNRIKVEKENPEGDY